MCSSQQAGHGCKQSLKEGGNGRRGSYQLQGKWTSSWLISGFPGGSDGKESAYNAGDPGLILGLGRSPGEGNGNSLQHSCLGNLMDREDWRATVRGGHKELDMSEHTHTHTHTHTEQNYN